MNNTEIEITIIEKWPTLQQEQKIIVVAPSFREFVSSYRLTITDAYTVPAEYMGMLRDRIYYQHGIFEWSSDGGLYFTKFSFSKIFES